LVIDKEKAMPAVKTVPANTEAAIINQILEEDGCIVLSSVLNDLQLKRLQNELAENFGKIPMCQGNFFGFATKRMSSVLAKSEISRDMTVHPAILQAMDHFLLKSCRQYQVNLTQAIQIWPGEPAQIIHTDDLMFPFELPVRGDQKMINCMWAVDDFTSENGATQLVPGSHKWPRERQAEEHEIVQGVMSAGSVLIYFGSLLHGGGANRSTKPRTGLVLSYCLGWLRQAENSYLALPLDLVKTWPERLQKLLGYFVHEPNLGCVEGQDPIALLNGEITTNGEFKEFLPAEVQGLLQEYRAKVAT
jgi:ectoine hydroxylase-related dioxygenase (phytanoyl-CoA dioxygenase family)